MIFDIETDRPTIKDYDGQPVKYVQEKADGHRVTIIKGEGKGNTHAYGKKPDKDLWPKMINCHIGSNNLALTIVMDRLPPYTVVDAEIIVPGKPASAVSTALANQAFCALVPFALPFLGGRDLRETPFHKVVLRMSEYGLYTSWNKFDPTIDYLKRASDKGLEGYVLKNGHYDQWYKVKPQKTADFVVTGVTEGKNRLVGLTGALKIALFDRRGQLVEIGVCGGGLTDDLRRKFTNKFIKGRVVEVEYQSILANGGLQFPRFVRLRDDKPAKQCYLTQIRK